MKRRQLASLIENSVKHEQFNAEEERRRAKTVAIQNRGEQRLMLNEEDHVNAADRDSIGRWGDDTR